MVVNLRLAEYDLEIGDTIQFEINEKVIIDIITNIHIGLTGINYYTKKDYIVSKSYLINSSKI
jgi:hypothetical protein